MDKRFQEIVRDRPELVTSFPEWMLPARTVEKLATGRNPAVLEVAGKDSVAAAVRAVIELDLDHVVPTVAFTGTEFGPWEIPFRQTDILGRLLGKTCPDTTVHGPVLLGAPRLWHVLNGRYISALTERYGFYTPCIGCHVYLHALRIPLAKATGCETVIAGERERHDGRTKLNQTGAALDAYVRLLTGFDGKLALPLRHVAGDEDVKALVNDAPGNTDNQLDCVLSGNYRGTGDYLDYHEGAITRFLYGFALPVAERAVSAYLSGEPPDYAKLTEGLL